MHIFIKAGDLYCVYIFAGPSHNAGASDHDTCFVDRDIRCDDGVGDVDQYAYAFRACAGDRDRR